MDEWYFKKALAEAVTVKDVARILLDTWDEKDPGKGNSWDDCCDDMQPCIDRLREVLSKEG